MIDQPTGAVASATPEGRATGFQAVAGGASQVQSGEALLVEAYAAIWLFLFALVALSWRRLRRIEARLDGLGHAIDEASRARDGAGRPDGGSGRA